MTPTKKLRKRSDELYRSLGKYTPDKDVDLLEAALIETRNEALEEAAGKMETFGKMYLDTGDVSMRQTGAVLSAYVVKIRASMLNRGDS